MKLLRLMVKGYKNLKNVTFDLEKSNGCTLVVGTNGSGKSNLLEVLSAIFSALYEKKKNVVPSFNFELEYQLTDGVFVCVHNNNGHVELMQGNTCEKEKQIVVTDINKYFEFLPEHVIAIYSGEEQRLWEQYYFTIYDEYNKQYFKNKKIIGEDNLGNVSLNMIYLNHYYWNLVASILLIHNNEDCKKFVLEKIGLKTPSGISFKFDVKKLKDNKNIEAGKILDGINPEKKDSVEISFDKYNSIMEDNWYENQMFSHMAVLTLAKDYKIIREMTIKCSDGVEIKELSEGEKKLLLIYGAINILSGNNLYLLDEPDAHLHEGRKQEIYELIKSDKKSQFLITSHSPMFTALFADNEVISLDVNDDDTCAVHGGEVANIISSLTEDRLKYINQTLFYEVDRPLIIVEGPSDVNYIRRAIEVLAQNTDKYNVLKTADIIHGGGASNVQMTINELMNNLSSKKKIIALYDRDEAGNKELKNAVKSYDSKIAEEENTMDNKTYQRNNIFYLKLPKTNRYKGNDFAMEDYFSKDMKYSILRKLVRGDLKNFNKKHFNINNVFNGEYKGKLKRELESELSNYGDREMCRFKKLLDKLCTILDGKEECKIIN